MNLVFHPELFECRNQLMEELLAADFRWLADYSSIDLDHENLMLEVCGIHTADEAHKMSAVARRLFPGNHSRIWFKDFGIEQAWILEIYLRRIP